MKYLLLILMLLTTTAIADTLHVPSEYSNIFSAISAAQDGDTVLVAPGEYCGGFGFQGKNIVVRSSAGADYTYLESPFVDWHCVMFTGGEDSTAILEGFSITNWDFDGESPRNLDPPDHGGGIYIIDSSPTIRDNIVINCVTFGSGAGIYVSNSSSLIENCTVSSNKSYDSSGGGIAADGTSISGSPFRIIDCNIVGNESDVSGGLSITHQDAEIINNIITDNLGGTGSGAGGIGINSPSVLLYSNYIARNDGATGGGVGIAGGSPTIIGNLIVENTAGLGGGIYEASGSTIHLENNTIAFNETDLSSGWGGGLISWKDTLSISNCIFWGNTSAYGSQICLPAGTNPSLTLVNYCDVQNGQDSIYLGPIAILYWGPGNIDLNPLFETGPLGDYHLSLSSPCIDAGNPASEYNDPEDPFNPGYALWPAMGYLRNDMGAFGGSGINYWLTIEEEESSTIEGVLSLKSFPNPFSTSCTVCYQLEEASHVNLSVYDLSGRLVETLVDQVVPSGQYSEYFDASDLFSGMYLIRLVAGNLSTSRRCIVFR